MRAGVVVAAQPGVEDLAVRAEELGLHSFWVNDTPMVHGDPFVRTCAPDVRPSTAKATGSATSRSCTPGRT
ncbi:hypothetical protein ACFY41_04385 [Streptomyces syringium]|uniref:hypothetical protein n=1 Tax=Streptomyces syringium TaxID=76729 RepID=UPI0036C1611C